LRHFDIVRGPDIWRAESARRAVVVSVHLWAHPDVSFELEHLARPDPTADTARTFAQSSLVVSLARASGCRASSQSSSRHPDRASTANQRGPVWEEAVLLPDRASI
jgi:hypothetical protein